MYEYKVVTLSVKESENARNSLAKEGWRLVAMVPNIAKGMGVIATLEKKRTATIHICRETYIVSTKPLTHGYQFIRATGMIQFKSDRYGVLIPIN